VGSGGRRPAGHRRAARRPQVHEVTRTGASRLAPGEAVPRCLSFSGDNPVEYWDEGERANPEPFNMAKVNAELAVL
jgi:hypothetical protein